MPYPQEHACRLQDPGKYDRLRRKNCDQKHDGKCIDVIYGVKDNRSEVQALRYPKDIWSPEAARKHCEDRGGSFEEASGEEDQAHPWFSMQAKDEDTAEITIFDEIGGWGGQSLADFKRAFDQVKNKKAIRVLVNSNGGDVFDGMAIYNLLASRREKVSVEVLGLAASIASVIALAGRELLMSEGSYLMVHNPTGFVMGGAEDMRKLAGVLEKIQGEIANIYAGRSSYTKEEALAKMAEETWYTPAEALEAGLADAVLDRTPAKAAFDLGSFRHVPPRLAALAAAARAELHTSAKTGGNQMKSEEILNKLKELSDEQRAALTPEQKAEIVASLGIVIPEDKSKTVEELQAAAVVQEEKISLLAQEHDALVQERDVLKAEKLQAAKVQLIEGALRAGKIVPKNKAQWEAMYDKDPEGTRKLLEQQQPVVDFRTLGSGAGGEEGKGIPFTAEQKLALKSLELSDEKIAAIEKEGA